MYIEVWRFQVEILSSFGTLVKSHSIALDLEGRVDINAFSPHCEHSQDNGVK